MSSGGKRFEVIHEEKSFAESTRILVDHETGVCYLSERVGTGCSLTVLVDAEGKPVLHSPTQA